MANFPKITTVAVLLLCFFLVGDALLPAPKDDLKQEDSTEVQLILVGSRKMDLNNDKDGGSGVVNWFMDTWRQFMTPSGEHEEEEEEEGMMMMRRQLISGFDPLNPRSSCKYKRYSQCVSPGRGRTSKPCTAYVRCHRTPPAS